MLQKGTGSLRLSGQRCERVVARQPFKFLDNITNLRASASHSVKHHIYIIDTMIYTKLFLTSPSSFVRRLLQCNRHRTSTLSANWSRLWVSIFPESVAPLDHSGRDRKCPQSSCPLRCLARFVKQSPSFQQWPVGRAKGCSHIMLAHLTTRNRRLTSRVWCGSVERLLWRL